MVGEPITTERMLAIDEAHVWHPYASMPAESPSRPVVSAHGVHLDFADRQPAIDAMSSWWCAIHGYRNPALDNALEDQVHRMSHVMFGGLTHEPAVRLAERLVALTPESL
jgi:adenosylmethionine---8-amino-7-oxononanoate aminotransferase